MNQHFWWYLTRASGLVAWMMLTASVIWGVVLATKAFPQHRRPKWLLAVHRWLAGLTFAFLGIHLGSLVLDSYVHFGLADVTVPFASDWKPGAVALGIIAAWLLVAVELTSLARRKLSKRTWHGIHLASYAVFWLTSLHATFAGTDSTSPIYRYGAATATASVVAAAGYRIAHRRGRRSGPTRPATDRVANRATGKADRVTRKQVDLNGAHR